MYLAGFTIEIYYDARTYERQIIFLVCCRNLIHVVAINLLTPNDLYMSRTAPLTSKRCILYIYSTNVSTEYFKHALYSPFFFLFKMQCVS